jgi:transcriptional regulator CtsR
MQISMSDWHHYLNRCAMKIGQTIDTPNGSGIVIMLIDNGVVVRHEIHASDLPISECRHRKPNLLKMTAPQVAAWKRDAMFTDYQSYPFEAVTAVG